MLGIAGGLVGAESQTKPNYDAAFVSMNVPRSVTAHQVFPVTITMRNTGTQTWEGWPMRLRAVPPPNNVTWGTDYILIAQGTAVKGGAEYVFRSHLKAPASPGKVDFQWQVCKDGEHWFGEVTPAKTIDMVRRPTTARNADAPHQRASVGKKVLAFDDFQYLGSFKPPKIVNDARGAFSESGLALRPMPDGRDRLFMNYTHPTQVLFEIEIPDLVQVVNGGHEDLKTAEVKQVWGPVKISQPGGEPLNPNGGFVWLEEKRTLVWTYDDWCRAGVFAETQTGHAYMAFVRLGTGRLGYDFRTITSAGAAECWYCYDPRDVGAAARGQTAPWQVAPRSMTRVRYPVGRTVTGACFDACTGRLYVCLSWAYPDGLESFPVIHVYQAS
jgi:hypothetical protein